MDLDIWNKLQSQDRSVLCLRNHAAVRPQPQRKKHKQSSILYSPCSQLSLTVRSGAFSINKGGKPKVDPVLVTPCTRGWGSVFVCVCELPDWMLLDFKLEVFGCKARCMS
eukprot:6067380-Amphidinium_carterae.2